MKKISPFLILFLFIVACNISRKPTKSSENTNYQHYANSIQPEFTIFHTNDTVSELHFKISSKEIMYKREDGINFYSNLLISYNLLPTYDSKVIIDSTSVRLVDLNNENTDKFLIGKINVKAMKGRTYFLRVKVVDLNRNIDATVTLAIEKNDDLNRQNFLVKDKNSDTPIFRNYIKMNEEITINYKSKISVNIFVRYYNNSFPLASPPFSIVELKPLQHKQDSAFTLQLDTDGAVNFSSFKKGFYHFQLDTSSKVGLTLFNYSDFFPEVKNAVDMISPLRFITSKQEFDNLNSSTNKKAAIENFWLNISGNQERAKVIIRKYYNRVLDANQYFTSYLEGWKTDRGMIFLIYGSPNLIYKTANYETWTYGEENNVNSLSYSFLKVNNPFTNNDFSLDRSVVFKQSWYNAVDILRQGKTYLQD